MFLVTFIDKDFYPQFQINQLPFKQVLWYSEIPNQSQVTKIQVEKNLQQSLEILWVHHQIYFKLKSTSFILDYRDHLEARPNFRAEKIKLRRDVEYYAQFTSGENQEILNWSIQISFYEIFTRVYLNGVDQSSWT